MAKQTVVIVLIIAAVAFESASAYTSPKCEKEMMRQMPMRKCMTWGLSKMGEGEQLEQCCRELGEMSSECRCNAVREMMLYMSGHREIMMMCQLPTKCRMDPCDCPRGAAAAAAFA